MSAAPTACDDRLWCKADKGCSNEFCDDSPDTYGNLAACCLAEFGSAEPL